MTPLETVMAAIAETPDPEALASTRYPVSDELDRFTRDLAEARAERDAVRAGYGRLREAVRKLLVHWQDAPQLPEETEVALGRLEDVWAALAPSTLPATPIASGQAGEREAIRAAEIEATAKKIYEGFAFLPGYVPWTVRGNSEKQEEARHLARRALATRDTGSAV